MKAGKTFHILILSFILIVSYFFVPVHSAKAATGYTTRVSVASDGTQGNGDSSNPSITADGRYVVFSSYASNLVEGDNNGNSDVFVRDLQLGTTELISKSSDGTIGNGFSGDSAISANGRFIVYSSIASNLIASDFNNAQDIFLYDQETKNTKRVSIASDGTEANDLSYRPEISGDGRFIVFDSKAKNLSNSCINCTQEIFLHDQQTGITVQISYVGSRDGEKKAGNPTISEDGSHIAYEGGYYGWYAYLDAYIFNRQTLSTKIVPDPSGMCDPIFHCDIKLSPAISADGRYLVYYLEPSNYSSIYLFIYDQQTSTNESVLKNPDDSPMPVQAYPISVTADGQYIVFSAIGKNLVPGLITENMHTIFTRDRQLGVNEIVSIAYDGTPANKGIEVEKPCTCITQDRRFIVFVSRATNLVTGDTNDKDDVFIRDRQVEPSLLFLSGHIQDMVGNGFPGVSISDGDGHTTTTDSNGRYSISVPWGWSGTVTPSKEGYDFQPSNRMYNNIQNHQINQDFTEIPEKYPIILLPGVMGSKLFNSPKGEINCALRPQGEIWLNLVNFLTPPNALYLNPTSPTPANDCDQISPIGIMDSGTFDAYSHTITDLGAAGYTVLPFAYDWRLSLEDSAVRLDEFIDNNKGTSQKVVLLGHSMGGLLARTYVSNSTRAQKIAQVISVGSPYWGAPVLGLRMRSGIVDERFKIPQTDRYLALPQVANIARNSPGVMQLLPSEFYINDLSAGYYYMDDKTPLEDWEATKAFFTSKPGKYGTQNSQLIEAGKIFHQNYDDLASIPPGIDYHVLAANNLPTLARIREYPCKFGPLPDTCFEYLNYLNGDGTVPYPSASVPGKSGSADIVTFTKSDVGKVEHGGQMQDSTFIAAILNILRGEPAKVVVQDLGTTQDPTPETFIQLAVWGNVEVSIRDGSNQFLGLDSNGMVVNEIPGSDYTLFGNQTIVVLPSGQIYTVTFKQQDNYPLQLKVTDFLSPSTNQTYAPDERAVFIDIPSSTDGVATLPIDLSQGLNSLQLSLDQDNNGIPEQTIPPTSILNEVQSQDISKPVTMILITGAKDEQGFYTGLVTATLSATDTGTGILKTEYSLDGGSTWLSYTSPINFTAEDSHVLLVRSMDLAGNQEFPWPYETMRPFVVSGNAGVGGATLSYTDGLPKIATSMSDGSYSFPVSYNWSGTVTPSKAGYTFFPDHLDYNTVTADQPNQNYISTHVLLTSYYSISASDGWILESIESSLKGGTLNAVDTTFRLGDEVGDKQYRAILSFKTGGLPDDAKITKAVLKIRKQGLMGTNPFNILGGLKVDIIKPFFGTSPGLVLSDFQAAAGKNGIGTFKMLPTNNWYTAIIQSAGYEYINLTGTTQFRLRFYKDDNDNNIADYMKFFSGNYGTVAARPTLIIQYYVP